MTSSKTSYGSGSWDAQDEQRMIDLTQEAEAAEQQSELDYNPPNALNQTFDSNPRPRLYSPDIISYFNTRSKKRKQEQLTASDAELSERSDSNITHTESPPLLPMSWFRQHGPPTDPEHA